MNYKSLFNLLYSTEISEATKSSIIDKIQEPIIESCEAEPLVETYLELLDTLVYSTASESLIYNIIDETFPSLDEAFINEVSDEWVKRKTEAGLKQRENAYKQAQNSVKSGLIGLSQLKRQDATKAKLEKGREIDANRAPKASTDNQPKAEGAMGKLKSAVGKVKQWAEKVSPMPKEHDAFELSRAIGREANKRGIGAETLRQQTTHKVKGSSNSGTSKVEASSNEPNTHDAATKAMAAWQKTLRHAKKIQDQVNKKKSKSEEVGKSLDKAFNTQKEPQVEQQKFNFDNDDSKEATTKTPKNTATTQTPKRGPGRPRKNTETTQTPKRGPGRPRKNTEDKTTKANNEVTASANKTPKGSKQSAQDAQRQIQNLKDKLTVTTDPAKREELEKRIAELEQSNAPVTANEAFSDLAILLLNTNITESCFVEVMEMVAASKTNADKVKKRLEQKKTEAMDDLYKEVAKGKPESPKKIEALNKIVKREERFNALYNKKFNNNN